MDHRRVGRVGKQPAGAVLQPDESRPEAPGARAGRLGTPVAGDRAGVAHGLTTMPGLRRLRTALRSWCRPHALDTELSEELHFHLEREVQANLEAGMAAE